MFCVHYINTLQIHSDNMVAKLKSIIAYWIKQNDLFSSQGKDTDIIILYYALYNQIRTTDIKL